MTLSKEQILKQMKLITCEDDILKGFACLGTIDEVYPTLPQEVLDCYRTWIWEWEDKSFRMATSDFGNSHCAFICEGIEVELINHLKGVTQMNKTTYICLLPNDMQQAIEKDLREKLSEEDFKTALSSRLCDLEEIITIGEYIKK